MATATAAALRTRLLLLLMAPRGEPLRAVQEAVLATLWAEIGGDAGRSGGGGGGDGGGGGGYGRRFAPSADGASRRRLGAGLRGVV